MGAPVLTFTLLGVAAFSLATGIEPWFQSWGGSRAGSKNVIQVALGDSQRLFARQIDAKADAYFHNGYYPSIYDRPEGYEKASLSDSAKSSTHEDCEEGAGFLGKPRDWIDRFSRNFFPSRHTHLGDATCDHSHCTHDHHDHDGHGEAHEERNFALQREVLPWLKLSATLDPERPDTYIVAAFWLRVSLNKADEAEQFLREGLQANPRHYEILFELGRIAYEVRHDSTRARNLWELSLQDWREREARSQEPRPLLHSQILGHLAAVEESDKNYPRALEYLTELKGISPQKDSVQKWMDDLRAKQTGK